jgi:hypothetical protein
MKRRLLYGAIALIALALMIALWQALVLRHASSGGLSDSGGLSPKTNAGLHHQTLVPESDPESAGVQSNNRSSNTRSSDQERRDCSEKTVAAQEKLIAEKRAKLSRWILANAVVYNPSDPPKGKDFDGVIDDQDTKRGNEVGGYADLKNELEVELKNLERMKAKLK